MKIIVAGSRDFSDRDTVFNTMDFVCGGIAGDIQIVSGTADGADVLGEYYAHLRGFELKRFPADWHKHGRSAGPIRNIEMGEYADLLIAFVNNKSTGSMHMVKYMNSIHKPYIALHFNNMDYQGHEQYGMNRYKIDILDVQLQMATLKKHLA